MMPMPDAGALPELDPMADPAAAGPSMDQKMDEMIAMQQAIIALLEGGGPPPTAGAPPGGPPPGAF